jgi:hypothetical protein
VAGEGRGGGGGEKRLATPPTSARVGGAPTKGKRMFPAFTKPAPPLGARAHPTRCARTRKRGGRLNAGVDAAKLGMCVWGGEACRKVRARAPPVCPKRKKTDAGVPCAFLHALPPGAGPRPSRPTTTMPWPMSPSPAQGWEGFGSGWVGEGRESAADVNRTQMPSHARARTSPNSRRAVARESSGSQDGDVGSMVCVRLCVGCGNAGWRDGGRSRRRAFFVLVFLAL